MTKPASEEYLSLMIAMARRAFEGEAADAYSCYGFRGSLEWEHCETWDDGYSAERFTITRGSNVRSEYSGGDDRPVIWVKISADSQSRTSPPSEPPLEVLRRAELSFVSAVPLDGAPDTDLGRFVERVMRQHGGQDLYQITSTCLTFTITFDDGPPWVSPVWRRRDPRLDPGGG